jgi:hypothetical protein
MKIDHKNPLHVLAAFCALMALVRILIVIFSDLNLHAVEDWYIALNIAAGHGYTLNPMLGPTALKTPVYPLFLLPFAFAGKAKAWVVVIQILCNAILPVLIARAQNIPLSARSRLYAGWILAAHPSYLYYPFVLEATNLFVPACILLLYLYQRNQYSALHTGLLSGIIMLLQPVAAPVLGIGGILAQPGKKRKMLFIGCAMMVLLPWTIRNYQISNRIIAGKSPFWMNFYEGFMPESHGDYQQNFVSDTQRHRIDSLRTKQNDIKMEAEYKHIVIPLITEQPLRYINKTLRQMRNLWWIPPRYQDNQDITFLLIRKIPCILINLFSFAGIVLAFKTRTLYPTQWQMLLALITICMYFTVVYGVTQTANIRFKLDFEWLQCLPAGICLSTIVQWFQQRRNPAHTL